MHPRKEKNKSQLNVRNSHERAEAAEAGEWAFLAISKDPSEYCGKFQR